LHPLPFSGGPRYAVLFWGTYMLWLALETIGSRMERSGDRSRFSDRGSYSLILILLWIALGLDSALSFLLPQASILWNRIAIFYLGVRLMPEAMAFRFYAMSILGRFFTYDVAVHVGQTVVEAGPYRYIRHQRIREVSSLSPDLVWRSEIGPVFWRFWLRRGQAIAVELFVEEAALVAALGEPYREYMRRTRRLIPFVS
jgi:protein-S-isoprenylcysteine O-methyltransferase Ste14